MSINVGMLIRSLRLVWRSAPGWTLANITVSLLRSLLPLLFLLLLKNLTDSILQPGAAQVTPELIIWPALLVVGVWLLDEIISDGGTFIRKKQALGLESHMYNLLHNKALRLELIRFEHSGYYDLLARATREAPFRPASIINNLATSGRSVISMTAMAAVLLSFSWVAAVVLLLVNIPAVWLRLHYAGVLYNFQKRQTPESRKAAYFNWLLTGDRPSREVRLFGLGPFFRSLFVKYFEKSRKEEIEIIGKRTLIEIISTLIKGAALLFIIIYGAKRVVAGEITPGETIVFLVAFRQGLVYIKEFLGSAAGLYEDSLYTNDIFSFLDLEENMKAEQPVISSPEITKSVNLDNVSFTYPGNSEKTIDSVSLKISKGEVVALVGPNGSGKSTLIRLLCRLYDPDSGSVKVDDTNVKRFDPEEYRRLFSVVFQDFMLYNMSAGENIMVGNSGLPADEKMMKQAAADAGIEGVIEKLPGGYNTPIGNLFDDSRDLSWGEWQKLALARALYRDAPFLILDEPSSALDASSEYEIFSRFREIVRGKTALLISHRFTNVSIADRIIVIENGRITENGSHDELMQRKGSYYSMYTKQSSRFGGTT